MNKISSKFLTACLLVPTFIFSAFADNGLVSNDGFSSKIKYRAALNKDDEIALFEIAGTVKFDKEENERPCDYCVIKITKIINSNSEKKLEDQITDKNGKFTVSLPEGDYRLTPRHKDGNYEGKTESIRVKKGETGNLLIFIISKIPPTSQKDRPWDERGKGTNCNEDRPYPLR